MNRQSNLFFLLIVCVNSAIVLSGIVAISLLTDLSLPRLINDTAAIGNVHPLTGALSSLGIVLWGCAAAICFYAACGLRQPDQRPERVFLVASGLLIAALALDDLFMIHEELAMSYLRLPETGALAVIGGMFVAYLATVRKTLPRSNWLFLVLACGMFAGSVLTDTVLKPTLQGMGGWRSLIEDGMKWVGITCWLTYLATTAHRFQQASADGLKPTEAGIEHP